MDTRLKRSRVPDDALSCGTEALEGLSYMSFEVTHDRRLGFNQKATKCAYDGDGVAYVMIRFDFKNYGFRSFLQLHGRL